MAHELVDVYGNPISSSTENNGTETATVVSTEEKPIKTDKSDELFIQTPIFILFCEYLGYVSAFLEFAENWCNPTKPMPQKHLQTFLEREARSLYDSMLEEFNEEEIHNLYKNFYTCGLDELEADLNFKRKKNGEKLPF